MSLTWTTNGKIWLALHGDQWAKIQRLDSGPYPYHVYIGNVIPIEFSEIRIEHEIDTEDWSLVNRTFFTLEQAQAWAAEKLGVDK